MSNSSISPLPQTPVTTTRNHATYRARANSGGSLYGVLRHKVLHKAAAPGVQEEANLKALQSGAFVDRHNRSKSMVNRVSSPLASGKDKGILKVLCEFAENKKRLQGHEIMRRHSEAILKTSSKNSKRTSSFRMPPSESKSPPVVFTTSAAAASFKENCNHLPYNFQKTQNTIFNVKEKKFKKCSSFKHKKPVSPLFYNSFVSDEEPDKGKELPSQSSSCATEQLKLKRTLTPGRYSKSRSRGQVSFGTNLLVVPPSCPPSLAIDASNQSDLNFTQRPDQTFSLNKNNTLSSSMRASSHKTSCSTTSSHRPSVTFQTPSQPRKQSTQFSPLAQTSEALRKDSSRFSIAFRAPVMTFCRRRSFSLNHDGGLVNDGDEVLAAVVLCFVVCLLCIFGFFILNFC